MFVANACTVCWTTHYKWQLFVVSDYYYFIMFNGLAWPVSSCLLVRNESSSHKRTHSRRMASLSGSLDFTFYYFLHLSGHKCLYSLCYHGARFISFSLQKNTLNRCRYHLSLHPHSHQKFTLWKFPDHSFECVTRQRFFASFRTIEFCFFRVFCWRRNDEWKKELKAQNHCKW